MPETYQLPLRFILFNLHPTSARLRVLSFEEQIFLPSALPKLSSLKEFAELEGIDSVHPSSYMAILSSLLQIQREEIEIVRNFGVWIETPNTLIRVFGLRYLGREPFKAPSYAQWLEMPDMHALSSIDKEAMRRLYTALLG